MMNFDLVINEKVVIQRLQVVSVRQRKSESSTDIFVPHFCLGRLIFDYQVVSRARELNKTW